MSNNTIEIEHIRTWDQIEKTDWRFGCELWFKTFTTLYRNTPKFDDTHGVILDYLKTIGEPGVNWKYYKYNRRCMVEFQNKSDWIAFLLVFK
jgi:hypothetical protein